jgi:hypothetical protein
LDRGDESAEAKLTGLLIEEAARSGRYAEALRLKEALAAKEEERRRNVRETR